MNSATIQDSCRVENLSIGAIKDRDESVRSFPLENSLLFHCLHGDQLKQDSKLEDCSIEQLLYLARSGNKIALAEIPFIYLRHSQHSCVQGDLEYRFLNELMVLVKEKSNLSEVRKKSLDCVQRVIDGAVENAFNCNGSSKASFAGEDSSETFNQPECGGDNQFGVEDESPLNFADLAEYILGDNQKWFEENSQDPKTLVNSVALDCEQGRNRD